MTEHDPQAAEAVRRPQDAFRPGWLRQQEGLRQRGAARAREHRQWRDATAAKTARLRALQRATMAAAVVPLKAVRVAL